MTRLATILALALTTALVVVSSAVAAAPHSAQTSSGSSHDGLAIAVIAGLGLLIGASALMPLGRRRGTHAQA
jgi:hypothetical protein